jgi:hypothetical protein
VASIRIDVTKGEGPGGEHSRRGENAIVATNVTGTVTDAVAVAVDGTSVFVDVTSHVGALIDSIGNAVAVVILGTSQDAIS